MAGYSHLLCISCSGCDAVWAGEDRAHCGSCHHTFDNVGVYDAHRVADRCRRPQELGLTATKNGIWLGPELRRRAS